MYVPQNLYGDLLTAFDGAIHWFDLISSDLRRSIMLVILGSYLCCNVKKEGKVD
jgi:hypothetical protein